MPVADTVGSESAGNSLGYAVWQLDILDGRWVAGKHIAGRTELHSAPEAGSTGLDLGVAPVELLILAVLDNVLPLAAVRVVVQIGHALGTVSLVLGQGCMSLRDIARK